MFLLDIYYLDIASLLCLPWKVKTNFLPSSPRSRLVMKHLPPKIIAALYAAVLHVKRGMWNSFILQGAGIPHRTSIAFTFLSFFFNSYFATSHIFEVILKEIRTTSIFSTLFIDENGKMKSSNWKEKDSQNRCNRENYSFMQLLNFLNGTVKFSTANILVSRLKKKKE